MTSVLKDWKHAPMQNVAEIGHFSSREAAACNSRSQQLVVSDPFKHYILLHTFNGPFSGTIQTSRYQKGKSIWILLKQETVSGSGISWAVCKSAPSSRQITTPAPHHSIFYRLDALPVAPSTALKH